MRAYVDHVLALLPFEPEAHQRLGGPTCTYIGHPLIGDATYGAGFKTKVTKLPEKARAAVERLGHKR